MPIVTLTTDFGHSDIYAGRFKGQLLSVNPDLKIIDISHQIPAFNIVTGAYSLKYTFESFPKGTFHIIRVNEQGIKKEGLLIAKYKGHFFLAPDNGLLPLACGQSFEWIRKVDFDKLSTENADESYALALEALLDGTYESISDESKDYIVRMEWAIYKSENMIRGMVVIVDYYGNLITNIHFSELYENLKKDKNISIQYRDREMIEGLVVNYNDVLQGDKMCRVNDLGFLEISINEGAASKLLGIKFGHIVNIYFHDN